MEVLSLININLSDGQDVFLMCRYKPGQKLRIILVNLNEGKAFTGEATDVDLLSLAARIKMPFKDFISLSKKALIQNEDDGEQFIYTLEKNCTDVILRWKSIDEEETVIDIGYVKLAETDYSSAIQNVFLLLSKEILTLNNKVLTLDKEFTKVKHEKDEISQLLSEAVRIKELVEKELYSKFILVLNEKKQKIKELKQKDCSSSVSSAKIDKNNKKRSKGVHEISESSDEMVDDVDVPGPSTSKRNCSLLFLDDDDESVKLKISPSKRRNRNKVTVNKTVNLLEPKRSQRNISMESNSEDELFNDL